MRTLPFSLIVIIAKEAEKWIEYQQIIDNAIHRAQEFLAKFSSTIFDGETASLGRAQTIAPIITKVGVT